MSKKSAIALSSAPRRRKSMRRQPPGRRWWDGPWLMVGSIGVVAAAILAIIVVSQRQPTASLPSRSELATVLDQVTQVPPEVFNAIGSGGTNSRLTPDTPPTPIQGKPKVHYVGAEFCPYCASERWSLIVALSRFGTFENLRASQSSADDVYPNTPTFTFDGSQYTSPYVDFVAVETATREHTPLQRLSAEQQALMAANNPVGSIPFVDIAGQVHSVGSGVDTSLLVGRTWPDIAARLSDPTDRATRSIIGNANHVTAAICQATGNQPAAVCSSPAVVGLTVQSPSQGSGGAL